MMVAKMRYDIEVRWTLSFSNIIEWVNSLEKEKKFQSFFWEYIYKRSNKLKMSFKFSLKYTQRHTKKRKKVLVYELFIQNWRKHQSITQNKKSWGFLLMQTLIALGWILVKKFLKENQKDGLTEYITNH